MAINNSMNNTSYGITVLGTANINAAAVDRATTIGNSTGASPLVLIGGTSGISLTSTSTGDITLNSSDTLLLDAAGVLELNSSAGVISIGNDAVAQNINIGTGAAARVITIGNATGASGLVLTAGSAGITLSGFVEGAVITDAAGVVSSVTGTAGYVLTANASGTAPSFQAPASGGILWTDVTGTSQAAAVDKGYTANNAGLVTITLPATAAYGSIIEVAGQGAGGWLIAQNAGQLIHFGSAVSTTGVTGSIASTLQFDTIRLVCAVADTEFTVLSSVGNLDVL